ncbi:MAG: adenylosuccinate synthase [Calditrichaeota bacterium]|jgi:adenylosuccinate synthase|nr:adenylosuccinate synthase [Calditrichota bacterium]MBT7788010.1 adenylosuccinate synthase [Calditrichota bacterium]
MPVTVVLGSQWGDEGKGKIVDLLSQNADVVARYQGGANAGHTVVHNGRVDVLHLIPSGILNPDCACILGSGMVIDPTQLLTEIEELKVANVSVKDRLFVSHRAHLIMPYHKILDGLNEKALGNKAIGVTGRGIGPAYTDKYKRIGIRIVDLLDKDIFLEKLKSAVSESNLQITKLHGEQKLDLEEIINYYLDFYDRITPYILDTSIYLNDAIKGGKNVLCEGAQGTLLDIDWGTYPYVTSSNSTAGGAITGLGIGPTLIDRVLGVVKAYTTRVGMGPFPTEFGPELEEKMRQAGDEYGATTGRARRCGWFDAVIARFATRVNGVGSWALTKLDVLSNFETLSICVAYEHKGRRCEHFPADLQCIENCTPIYEEHPGWMEPISHIKHFIDLPKNAQAYINRIEELTETPVEIISVGKDRNETIIHRGSSSAGRAPAF